MIGGVSRWQSGGRWLRGARAIRWVLNGSCCSPSWSAYFAVTGVQVWLTSRHHDARPVAGDRGHGCGPVRRGALARPRWPACRRRRNLWQQHLASHHGGDWVQGAGDQFTEAQASATWSGAPRRALLGDRRGRRRTTRWTNLSARCRGAARNGGSTKILIVTDGFHEDRSLAIASDLGLQAVARTDHDSPIKGWSTVPYFAKETVGVALGPDHRVSQLACTGSAAVPGPRSAA